MVIEVPSSSSEQNSLKVFGEQGRRYCRELRDIVSKFSKLDGNERLLAYISQRFRYFSEAGTRLGMQKLSKLGRNGEKICAGLNTDSQGELTSAIKKWRDLIARLENELSEKIPDQSA